MNSSSIYMGPYFITENNKEAHPGDLVEKIKEQMYYREVGEKVLWLPNVNREAPREMRFDPNVREEYVEAGLYTIFKESMWLAKAFTEEYVKILEVYGDVKVGWGLINTID